MSHVAPHRARPRFENLCPHCERHFLAKQPTRTACYEPVCELAEEAVQREKKRVAALAKRRRMR